MSGLDSIGALVGRIFLGVIFVLAGFGKFGGLAGTAGFMASKGFPEALTMPGALVAAIIELVCGLMIIVGFQARLAALIVFLFMVPTTLIFHPFATDQVNFMKNLAIMGGLLIVATQGGGGLSVDSRRAAA